MIISKEENKTTQNQQDTEKGKQICKENNIINSFVYQIKSYNFTYTLNYKYLTRKTALTISL